MKERDTLTNYDYFGARYYDIEPGRWLSVDPLWFNNPGISPYAYCSGDPVNRVDPDVMDWEWIAGIKIYVLPEVNVTPKGYNFSYSAEYGYRASFSPGTIVGQGVTGMPVPMPNRDQSLKMVKGALFLGKQIEKFGEEFRALEVAIVICLYHKYQEFNDDDINSTYRTSGFQKMKNGNNKQKNNQFAETLKIMGIKKVLRKHKSCIG